MGRRVARTLPNGRASPFLYEVAMDEAKFQRNEKRVREHIQYPSSIRDTVFTFRKTVPPPPPLIMQKEMDG